jgi:ABC-type sugar transport system ATPase subunit
MDEYLVVEGISKRYGVVQALKEVSFSVKKGEIHTLLGENGAGKSTLVKIIKGEIQPDKGTITVENRKVEIYSPVYAKNMGISMVHQELAIFENMSIAENIFPPGTFRTKWGLEDKETIRTKTRESLELFNLDLEPDEKMENLSLAEQQMVEILRSISLDQKIILLDEPTSGLKEEEIEQLVCILKQLRERGITILYISHHIPEILELSDRVTILRDGRFIETIDNNEGLTEFHLVSAMVGSEFSNDLYGRKAYSDTPSEEVFMSVDNFSRKKSIQNINFNLMKGEILGFFGLEGAGADELSRSLFGLDPLDEGSLTIQGKKIGKINPEILIEKGILYLNNNRKKAGLMLDLPASDNMAIPVVDRMSRFGIIDSKSIREYTEEFIKKFSITIPDSSTSPRKLSGGNQQKLMMSICLGTDPDCVIINEPTRGVDVGAKAEIHKVINDLASRGMSIILFSSELPELITLSDRIGVFNNKRLNGILSGKEIDQEKIMTLAAGESTRKECHDVD